MSAAVSADWETSDVTVPVVVRSREANTGSATGSDDDGVDAATASLRDLKLLAPPPRSEGHQPQQPSPQHALYDPNATYAQPVSPATATAAVARFGQLDPVLLAGLENARERLSLLKFEDQIVRFVRNPREMQLSFPPLSSYHRLIVHRLADRCGLEHQTADFGSGYDGNSARGVTLFKTAQTIVPRVLLIDLSADMQAPTVTPASAPKIMVRKRNAPRGSPSSQGGRGNANGQDAKNQQRSIEDRERAYAEARARIFGEDASSSSSSSTAESSSTISSSSTATASASSSSGPGSKFGGSAQASGPDGSRGFGRGGSGGRGSAANSQTNSRQARDSSPPSVGHGNTPGNSNRHGSSGDKPSLQQQQNWKESKVLWRNREQELNDPDFTRNHDAYRPARDQHHSGGGGGGGRFGAQQSYYYDGPRPYGYQGGTQSGYPGRGRGGPPHNEYSRIDPMQHRLHQQGAPPLPPAPPSDFYRHNAQQAPPPPPPPGAYNTSYSPHGRGGGYGSAGAPPPPPPPPSSQQQQLRRGSAGGSYNDDFPPLGK